MKKILTITLSVLLVITAFIPVYGALDNSEDESVEQTEQLPEVLELSLEDAVEYALLHNKDITIAELNIKKTEVSYDKQRKDIKEFDNLPEEF